MRFKCTYIYLLLLVTGLTVRQSMFLVWEGQQVLITQFGEIVREPITHAGLHFKIPFIQRADFQDRRLLTWEGTSEQVPTGDQRYISVKSVAQWRVEDLSRFIQTVQTIPVARARLDSIINGAVRNVVSSYPLTEVVRLDNRLLEHPLLKDDVAREQNARAVIADERELHTIHARISHGRARLEKRILEAAAREAAMLGISLATVNMKQLSYQELVEHTVSERMISERTRVAEKIRAIGRGEEARIRGKLAFDFQKIVAPAHREAEEIKGAADAEAIRIYSESLELDPKFYTFLRTMDAYRRALPQKQGGLIVSSDSTFFRGLKQEFSE